MAFRATDDSTKARWENTTLPPLVTLDGLFVPKQPRGAGFLLKSRSTQVFFLHERSTSTTSGGISVDYPDLVCLWSDLGKLYQGKEDAQIIIA